MVVVVVVMVVVVVVMVAMVVLVVALTTHDAFRSLFCFCGNQHGRRERYATDIEDPERPVHEQASSKKA